MIAIRLSTDRKQALLRLTDMTSTTHSEKLTHYPAFLCFWLARLFNSFSFNILSVAVGWQIYDITGSAFHLGLIGLIQFIPALVFALPAGHVADQYHRRKVMIFCICFEWLGLLSLSALSFSGQITQGWILLLIGLIGLFRTFESPASQSIVPALVPERILPRALAVNAAGGEAASIIGPALGGFLYLLGVSYVYAIAAGLTLIALLLVTQVKYVYQQPPRMPMNMKNLFSGVRFIRGHSIILGVLSLDLFAVLLGGATALMPIFAKDILHTGPWGLGLLQSAPGVGALLMSLVLARFTIERNVGMVMFSSVAAFGMATIIFGLSTSLLLSLSALFVLGAVDMVSMVIRGTLVQLETPDEMRGRVNSVYSIFVNTSNQLGEFESGMMAAAFGAVGATLIGGIGTLAVVGLWMFWFPDIRQRQRLVEQSKAHDSDTESVVHAQ